MIFHKPNSWNGAETLNKHKQIQVGTADGTTSEISLPFDVQATDAISSTGTSTSTLDDVNDKIILTAGTIYDIIVTNSTGNILAKYPVDEGTGTSLTDSSGNGVHATLTTAVEADWWANKVTPPELVAMDAGIGFFVDQVTDETLTFSQTALEELGGELSGDVSFNDTATWNVTGNGGSVSGGQALLDGASAFVRDTSAQLPIGTFEVTIDIATVGYTVVVYGNNSSDGSAIFTDVGVHTKRFTTTGGGSLTILATLSASIVDSMSIREVNPVINNNKQYYFTNCSSGRQLLEYKETLLLAEDEDVKIISCLIEPVTYNGETVTYNGETVYGPIL